MNKEYFEKRFDRLEEHFLATHKQMAVMSEEMVLMRKDFNKRFDVVEGDIKGLKYDMVYVKDTINDLSDNVAALMVNAIHRDELVGV